MKTLIFGIGNTLKKDDGIGIVLADKLRKESFNQFDIESGNMEPLDLINRTSGYERVIILDAIKKKNREPGEIIHLKLEDLPSYPMRTSHGMDLKTALQVGMKNEKVPEDIHILGITVKESDSFGDSITDEMKDRLPEIIKKLKKLLRGLHGS